MPIMSLVILFDSIDMYWPYLYPIILDYDKFFDYTFVKLSKDFWLSFDLDFDSSPPFFFITGFFL